jgi:hypothetical protein
MIASPKPDESVMALIAHKIAPFQFDISHSAASASIRDQVVRAQMVVRALLAARLICEGQSVNATHPLLICGAGVAGMAAAFEATRLGVYFIMIDKAGVVPGGAVSGTGQRYASPTMYEWPASIVDEHIHPLADITFLASASSGNEFNFGVGKPELIGKLGAQVAAVVSKRATQWEKAGAAEDIRHSWLLKYTQIEHPSKLALRALLQSGSDATRLPEISFSKTDGATMGPYRFSCILFAGGFSEESTDLQGHTINTPQFWQPDTLLDPALGTTVKKPLVLVVAGGDGAIQDAMRVLLRHKKVAQPLAVWEYLIKGPTPKKVAKTVLPAVPAGKGVDEAEVYRQILTVEAYSATAYSWVANNRIYKDIDVIYADLAKRLIVHYPDLVQRVAAILRSDIKGVYISTRGGFSRAYALNRFLIHLIVAARACLVSATYPTVTILTSEVSSFIPATTSASSGAITFADGSIIKFDLIVLRKGAKCPAYQAIGITGIDPARINFGRLPVPLMAPNPTS